MIRTRTTKYDNNKICNPSEKLMKEIMNYDGNYAQYVSEMILEDNSMCSRDDIAMRAKRIMLKKGFVILSGIIINEETKKEESKAIILNAKTNKEIKSMSKENTTEWEIILEATEYILESCIK